MKKTISKNSAAKAAVVKAQKAAAAEKAAARYVRAKYYRADGTTKEIVFQNPSETKVAAKVKRQPKAPRGGSRRLTQPHNPQSA